MVNGTNETIFSWFECNKNSNQKQKKNSSYPFCNWALNSNNVQYKRGDYPRYRTMREWIVRRTHKTHDKSASQANAHKQQPNSKYFISWIYLAIVFILFFSYFYGNFHRVFFALATFFVVQCVLLLDFVSNDRSHIPHIIQIHRKYYQLNGTHFAERIILKISG